MSLLCACRGVADGRSTLGDLRYRRHVAGELTASIVTPESNCGIGVPCGEVVIIPSLGIYRVVPALPLDEVRGPCCSQPLTGHDWARDTGRGWGVCVCVGGGGAGATRPRGGAALHAGFRFPTAFETLASHRLRSPAHASHHTAVWTVLKGYLAC